MVVCRFLPHRLCCPIMCWALFVGRAIFGADDPVATDKPVPAEAAVKADDTVRDAVMQRFAGEIAPLLERSCVACHNSEKREGGLALDSAAGLTAGGDSGPVVVAGDPSNSPLLSAVTPSGTDRQDRPAMPRGRPALTSAEVAALRAWIDAGAAWPPNKILVSQQTTDEKWWSLAQLSRSVTPQVANGPAPLEATNAIDGFIQAAQSARGLMSSPPAPHRDLIRRVTYDLTGLPPSIDDVTAFVADARPDAYERLVDRLLASPAFGERWARHWLDVVHYGESHGYDKDKPRTNAWPYRDYVIGSFNSDKPYRQFVAEQIAGDVIAPHDGEAIEAVGFLSAGPWDFIGHAEVPETKLDGKTARHLDRDDMVQNTFLTFQSLTVGCAQCHDHKFDPITQREYYGLQAVFAALDRADRKYYRQPDLQARLAALQESERRLAARAAQASDQVRRAGGDELAKLDEQLAAAKSERTTGKQTHQHPVEHGYHSAIERTADALKWVQIDLGEAVAISRIQWIACHDDFAGIGDGFGAPPRWRLEISTSADFSSDVRVVVDQTEAAQPNPGIAPQNIPVDGLTARYVRFTATELAHRQNDYIFALAELGVFNAAGENLAFAKPVSSLDSIESPPRWSRANLVDNKAPSAAHRDEASALATRRTELLQRTVARPLLDEQERALADLAAVRRELSGMPPPAIVYAATIHQGKGAFAGTGANGGRPRPVYLLQRGDISRPGPEVEPLALSCLSNLKPQLAANASGDAERRIALSGWLTDDGNPLTWRSIANRIWAYHFHRGIVDTPNDFGRMGSQPSHPELLDHLALEVREQQSLKRLHRAIVLSSTYRQSSELSAQLLEADPDNRWLTRSPRRRLEAEAVRDSMLAVAGRLRREMGGPSYQDFVIEHPEHSPHYEYALHDPRDPDTMRRSIYRFIARSQTHPLMTSLDCADPSIQVDVRSESTSATQALSLLHNALTIMAAEEWAERVGKDRNITADSTRLDMQPAVRSMFADALSREPDDEETVALAELAEQHGLFAVARVIFNLSEFFYVD